MPDEMKPEHVPAGKRSNVETSWTAITAHWGIVLAELSLHHHVDLYEKAALARPWMGVRGMIFELLGRDTRLRAALTRR
ncbi:hypothetical protein CH252_19170 [Rhodococcus sp. 06-1477-1B]|nr:hypothetical protein CH252_19170 [Rhodococcus sp. 06-1477-1B]